MKHYQVLREIAKDKGISLRELGRRAGYKGRPDVLTRPTDTTMRVMSKVCDALGVELCIIDGWKKYRLNEFKCLPEVQTMFNEMEKEEDHLRDFYKEHKEVLKGRWESWSERYEDTKTKQRCRSCAHCVWELERDGVNYCREMEDYIMRKDCGLYHERDLPEI